MSLVLTGITQKPIKIPSAMYPLNGQRYVFRKGNTCRFPETERTQVIKRVYDAIDYGVGTCYSNTETLIDALEKEGIQAYPFVGWLFIGGSLPVHHCFAAVPTENPEDEGKRVHLLDFTFNFELLDSDGKYKEMQDDMKKAREAMVEDFMALKSRPNSESTVFGQALSRQLYIVAPCQPMEGLAIYRKLMMAYPKHPCYRNIENGASETQRMYYEKQGKLPTGPRYSG